MKLIFLLTILFSIVSATSINDCRKLSDTWYAYHTMSEKAFLSEKNIIKSTKLKILAVETAEKILHNCPISYFDELSKEDGSGLPAQYWKDDMKKYIDKHRKIIEKHQAI